MDTPCRVFIIASLVLISTAFIACGARGDKGSIAPILLFSGTGASPNDVAAVETILHSNHLNYSTVNSSQLNELGESQIRRYRLLIIPGGNFVDIGNSLTLSTTANIRNGVQNGRNYPGIRAGGFFAETRPYHDLNLTSGVRVRF